MPPIPPLLITVVSGLPRSGTSLVMQMLAAGGVPILADGERAADLNNPRGYHEYAPIKSLAAGAPWIADARGKAIKVISQLLEHLPAGESYRVLYLRRNLDEVLASQQAMLARLGQPAPPQAAVRAAFERHLAQIQPWLATQPYVNCLALEFAEVIARPVDAAASIAELLQLELDIEQMAAAVDPKLYRERRT